MIDRVLLQLTNKNNTFLILGHVRYINILTWLRGSRGQNCNLYKSLLSSSFQKRVPNRFGGMRDSAFFSRDIRDLSSRLGREVGIKITSGSGISCFHGVGIRDSQREQSGIRDFNPSFRVPLKPWSSRHHFFSHFASFRVTHDKLSERGTSKIDPHKNRKLAETNLLYV